MKLQVVTAKMSDGMTRAEMEEVFHCSRAGAAFRITAMVRSGWLEPAGKRTTQTCHGAIYRTPIYRLTDAGKAALESGELTF